MTKIITADKHRQLRESFINEVVQSGRYAHGDRNYLTGSVASLVTKGGTLELIADVVVPIAEFKRLFSPMSQFYGVPVTYRYSPKVFGRK